MGKKEPFFNNKNRKKKMKKTSELIIDTLLSGAELRTPEIKKNMEAAGHKMELSNIASMLRVLSDKEKCNLGYFLNRERTSKGFVYSIVKEALELTPEQLYGLTRKIGKKSFSLKQAMKEIPSLEKYIKPSKKTVTANSDQNDILIKGLQEIILQGGVNFNITCHVQLNLPDSLKE